MALIRIVAEPVWNWVLVAAAAGALIGIVLVTYPPRVRHLPRPLRRTLLGLRLASALILIFAMLRPAVQFLETDSQGAVLVVLMDRSRSMTTPDGPGGISRREHLVRTLQESDSELAELAEEVELMFVDFHGDLLPTEEPTNEADGQFTALGKVLDVLRREDTGKRLVGVVLMSDGAQRAVGEDDVDPRAAARRFAEVRGVPVHTMLFGTSELSSAGVDLAIEDVLVRPDTFEKKTTPVRAQLRMTGAAGRTARVRLLIEDRRGKRPGESGELVEIPLASGGRPFTDVEARGNAVVVPIDLSFVAESAGEYKLAIEAVPLDGELKSNNNRVETLITVRQGGLKVAYYDILRPEQKFIRRLNETAEIQLDWEVVNFGAREAETRLDPAKFEPGAYDAYVIGDVTARAFRQPGGDMLNLLAQRVNDGAGLAMIGGRRNFSAGGYADTPLRDLLPVLLDQVPPGEVGQVDPVDHHSRKLQMVPAPDGLRHYLMQVAPRDNRQAWLDLPPLSGATRLEEKSENVEILAMSEDEVPLLFATDTGRSRVVAFAGDDTYRWFQHGYGETHQRFWQQLMLWLARKDLDTDAPIWLRIDPRNFSPGATVPLTFGARDEEGAALSDVEFEIDVLRPDGEHIKVTPQRQGEEGFAEFIDTTEPGDYWVTVAARRDGSEIALPALGRFIVDQRDLELDNPAADPDLLAEIASITGTTPLPPEELGTFIDSLLEQGISTDITRQTQMNLWDNWGLLLLFVGLLSLEWFLRKRRGLV